MSLLDRKNIVKKEMSLAGRSVSVIEAPRPLRQGFVSHIFLSISSLLNGMKITWKYISKQKTVVTRQYPENRSTLKHPERYRAQLRLKYDEKGHHNCTGCKICDTHCPNDSIHVIEQKAKVKGKEIDRYVWRMDTCTFCNLCVMVCPFDALEFSNEFENAVFDKGLLTYQLNRYAGPTKKNIEKMEDPSEAEELKVARKAYDGPIPLMKDLQSKQKEEEVQSYEA